MVAVNLRKVKYNRHMENTPIQGPVFLIETEKIVPNPQQPRREFNEEALRDLANSIREVGLLQPVIVSKIEKETEFGTEVSYQLIAGERRLLASKKLGLERIPAIIKQVNLDRERLELALVENIQRADLNPLESARAFARFQDDFGMTQREIATRLGKSRAVVANMLRLLNLPTEVQDAVAKGAVSESQARLLLGVTDQAQQKALFEELMSKNLSVRDLQLRIRDKKVRSDQQSSTHSLLDPETIELQKNLEVSLGTKVKLERSGATGKITISFFSSEELYGIVQKLSPSEPGQKNVFDPAEQNTQAPQTTDANFSIGTEHTSHIIPVEEEQSKDMLGGTHGQTWPHHE